MTWERAASVRRPAIFFTTAIILLAIVSFSQKASLPKQPTDDSLAQQNVKELLLLMDSDKNGKISKLEWMKLMGAEFDSLDKTKKANWTKKNCCNRKSLFITCLLRT